MYSRQRAVCGDVRANTRRSVNARGDTDARAAANAALTDGLKRAVYVHSTTTDAEQRRIVLPHPFSNMSREDWLNGIALWRQHGLPLLLQQPARPCPACRETQATPLFESYDGYGYVECDACGAWYVPLVVDHDLFERYFALCPEARRYGDYTLSQADDGAAQRADAARFTEYYADLRALLGPNATRTLDMGCGVGNSFLAAADAGFEATGVEVNEEALAAAARMGRRVERNTNGLDTGSFDCVTFWESLEHMDDVDLALAEAAKMLAPSGVLAITVPNLNSPIIRSMRGDSMQIHGGPAWPGHINLFTADTLARPLKRAGFEVTDVVGQYTMNLYEFVGYHLGVWRGARDYIAKDEPSFTLSAPVCDLIDTLTPVVAAWETHCAMGPILRVFARRDGPRRSLGAARRAALETQWGVVSEAPVPRATLIDLEALTEFKGDNVTVSGDRLDIWGAPDGAFTYAWVSQPMELAEGDRVSLRGKLRAGAFSFGLLRNGAWAEVVHHKSLGVFELQLSVRDAAAHQLVIAHHLEPDEELDLSVDLIEMTTSET